MLHRARRTARGGTGAVMDRDQARTDDRTGKG
jgi:hypothetical protein